MRYPLQPLLDKAQAVTSWSYENGVSDESDSTQRVLAELLHVSRKTIGRWSVEGIPSREMDRAAVALGLHPVSVWSDWYEMEMVG